MMSRTVMAGFNEPTGSWNTTLDGLAVGAGRSASEAGHVEVAETDRAGGRVNEGAGSLGRAWSCPSPTRPPRPTDSPPPDRDARVLDGTHVGPLLPRKSAASAGKDDREVCDFQEAHCRALSRTPLSSSSPIRTHRLVPVALGDKRHRAGPASFYGVVASVGEVAVRRPVPRRGHHTWDGREFAAAAHVAGNRSNETLGVRVLRCGEHVIEPAGLHDLTCVHHRHAIGQIRDDTEVVGDQQHRHVAVARQLTDQVQHLALHRHVQRRRGFVGDQQLGAARECHRGDNPLRHAAGELMGIVVDA